MRLSKRVSAFLLCTLAVGLVSVVLFDIYEDWQVQGAPLPLTVLENAIPFLLASSLLVVTYWLYQSRSEQFVATTAKWTVLGAFGILFIGALALLLQGFQGEVKPFILLFHTVIGGSCAGVLIGYHVADVRQTRRELERSNDRLEEFASVVSHDLRNPLQVARGQVEVARETGDEERFDMAEDALDRMDEMVDDVLTLARSDGTVENTAPVDLRSIAANSWETVATDDATLEIVDTTRFRADDARLRQLLENLFGNAVMHGGPRTQVRVGTLPEGFYVEDDGPGVPPDDRDAVFETGYSTSEDGTGLGLSIVADIADAHGWEVSATEGTTGGARFEISGVDSLRTTE